MNKKILLLIDCQYDFINGSLAVNGAEDAMDALAKFIIDHGNEYSKIILTADFHPQTHCSFENNGGTWPIHCVQHTHGAAIYQPIINALNEIKSDYCILTKGTNEDREEYSIFKNNKSRAFLLGFCQYMELDTIDVCGIAFDYCVSDTVRDGLKELPNVKFNVIDKFSPSIAENTKNDFLKFIENSERICLV